MLQHRSRDRSHSVSCHPMANSDRFDGGYLPTLGRTVSALRLDEHVIDSVSICPRPGHILSRLHIPRPHVPSKEEL